MESSPLSKSLLYGLGKLDSLPGTTFFDDGPSDMTLGSTHNGMSFLANLSSDRLFKEFLAAWHGHVAQLDKAVAS